VKLLLIAIATLGVLLVLGGPVDAAGKNVTMHDASYDPATVSINVNDDVFWCNPSTVDHTVTFDDGSTKDFPANSGCSGRTFQTAGSFGYHCKLVSGMSGRVLVGGSSAPPPPPPPPPPPAVTSTTARKVTTTAALSRVATTVKRTATTVRANASATTDPSITVALDEPSTEASTTTTLSRDIAIKERDSGGGGGTAAALIAVAAMTVAGTGYFVYRLRMR
jgi:plastocyanin